MTMFCLDRKGHNVHPKQVMQQVLRSRVSKLYFSTLYEMMVSALSAPSESAQHQPRDSKRRFSCTMSPVQRVDLVVRNATSSS